MAKIKKIQVPTEDMSDSVSDVHIKKLIPNVIDGYLVAIIDDHHTIIIPMNITGTQFRAWKRGRGGIFSKDVLNHSLGKKSGKYVLIKTEKLYCIARIISEDEELNFKTLKLLDGQIKDISFMILKKIQNGKKLINTQRYINEKDILPEDITICKTASIKTSQDDDIDYHVGSISLFSE